MASPPPRRPLHVQADLRAVVATITPPTSPRVSPHEDQVQGLALLDTGLRLAHLTRVAESLEYHSRFSLRRAVSTDIDLSRLPPQVRGMLRNRRADGNPDDEITWVPVARHSRVELSSVNVVMNTGDLLPRLPQRDCLDLLVNALVRILRMTIAASSEAATKGSLAYRSLHQDHRALWCIERAVAQYVDEGGSAAARTTIDWAGAADPSALSVIAGDPAHKEVLAAREEVLREEPEDHPEHIRVRALGLLDELFPQRDDPFFELVRVAAGDHMLVAGVPADQDVFQVRYDAPLLQARHPHAVARLWRSVARGVVPTGTDYLVDYETTVPRHAKSFHVDVGVDPDVTIRGILLSTDDDVPEVEEACDAFDALAAAPELWAHHEKIVEHELQTSLLRLGGILERRISDLDRSPPGRARSPHFRRFLARRWDDGTADRGTPWSTPDGTFRRLGLAVRRQQLGRLPHLARTEGFERPDDLRRLSRRLRDLDLGWSCRFDNDPRADHAHVHWTSKMDNPRQGTSTIHARVRIVLADETPSLAENVRVMVLGLVGVVYMLGLFDSGVWYWPWPWLPASWSPPVFDGFGQADAVIAILLLAPGLLLSRLDLPHPDTALGQLRLFPRHLSYVAVVATAVLGIVIAVGETDNLGEEFLVDAFRGGLLVLAVLGLLCQVELLLRAARRRWLPMPTGQPIPRWFVVVNHRRHSTLRSGDSHFAVGTERAPARGKRDGRSR
jgi:hypothetical protein